MWELSDEGAIDPGVAVAFIKLPDPIVVLEPGEQAATRKIPTMTIGNTLRGLFKFFLLGIDICGLFPKGKRIGIRKEAPNGLWRMSN